MLGDAEAPTQGGDADPGAKDIMTFVVGSAAAAGTSVKDILQPTGGLGSEGVMDNIRRIGVGSGRGGVEHLVADAHGADDVAGASKTGVVAHNFVEFIIRKRQHGEADDGVILQQGAYDFERWGHTIDGERWRRNLRGSIAANSFDGAGKP